MIGLKKYFMKFEQLKIGNLKKIDSYIIRKFLGTYFYSILLLSVIIIIFDVSEKIDDFMEKDASLKAIAFQYYLNFIPYFINMFSALFTFIAVVFFTSRMAANTEIIAILSSGVSFWRMLRPYFISAVILTILSFLLMNFVIPRTSRQLRAFEKQYLKNPFKREDVNLHMQLSPGTYVYVESYNAITNSAYRFSMEKFTDKSLALKMTSDVITWDSIKKKWKLSNYVIRKFSDNTESLRQGTTLDTVIRGDATPTGTQLTPNDYLIDIEDSKLMTYKQLGVFIKREKMRGNVAVKKFEIEKYKRIAFPFANLILTFIGVALSCRKVRGGTGLHMGLGIAISFTFILLLQITSVFAVFGNLNPSIALWIPNFIFGIVAIWLLRVAPK
jgi:lipopolysaccharide export system permease protein